MKYFRLLIVLLITLNSTAQVFQIADIVEKDRYDRESKFPILTSNKYPNAAKNINAYLHLAILSKVVGKTDTSMFSNVFALEDEYWGQSLFAYSINRNDDKIFSISIAYDNTGSFTERFEEQFNFVAKTGEHIVLSDFFDDLALEKVGAMVNQHYFDVISNFMNSIDQSTEDGVMQHEMYSECLQNFENNQALNPTEFKIAFNELIFLQDRCSNHMMASFDELWVLEFPMQFKDLSSFFNQNASTLINNGKWKMSESKGVFDKILNGKIGKDSDITARINWSDYPDKVKGVFWFNSKKDPIDIVGSFNSEDRLVLHAIIDGFDAGTFTGEIANGQYTGSWLSKNGKKSVPFTLSLN